MPVVVAPAGPGQEHGGSRVAHSPRSAEEDGVEPPLGTLGNWGVTDPTVRLDSRNKIII